MTQRRRTSTPLTAMTHVQKSSCASRDWRHYRIIKDRRELTTRGMSLTGVQASLTSVPGLNKLSAPHYFSFFKRFFSKPSLLQRVHL